MAKELKIEIEFFWTEEQTDCSECSGCEETIFSKMYSLIMFLNKNEFQKTDMKLCDSCFDAVGEELIKL